MRHWNYRLVCRVYSTPQGELVEMSIHEVYYDDDGVIFAWAEAPASPFGETFFEIQHDLEMIALALTKPTLNYDDLPKGGSQ